MGYYQNKPEYKEVTTITLYPSTKAKAKRLKVNISKIVEQAIAALPESEGQENAE